MVTEDYVSFDTAKLLKEKGFEGRMHTFYTEEGTEMESAYVVPSNFFPIYRPTLQRAMKWLREVHKIHIEIGYNVGYFPVCISTKTNETIPYKPMQGKDFTYEQACEVAIKYCLENLI